MTATPAAPAPRASARLLRACALFGLDPALDVPLHQARLAHARDAAQRIDNALAPGEVALITGPSGAGKSLILHALRSHLGPRAAHLDADAARRARGRRPVLSLLRLPLRAALDLLARAGLADATLLARAPDQLSDGQRWRLALALAMSRTPPRGTLLIDEFASPLDRTTAVCLARTLRRWARRSGVRIAAATAHDDLLEPLAPALLILPRHDAPALAISGKDRR